jgi:hypothetical protein
MGEAREAAIPPLSARARQPLSRRPPLHSLSAARFPRPSILAPDFLGAPFVDRPIQSSPPSGIDAAARAKTGVEPRRGGRLNALHPAAQRARMAVEKLGRRMGSMMTVSDASRSNQN